MKTTRRLFSALIIAAFAAVLACGVAFASPAIEERAGEGAATTLPSDAVLPVAEGGGSDAAVGNAAEGLPYQPVPLSGVFLIRPSGSDVHVLDVADGSIANSTNVQLYRSNMTAGQRFAIEPVYVDGLPYCRVLVTIDGVQKALDVADAVSASGTNVQIYEPNGSNAQLWSVERAEDGSYVFHSALDPRFVLDVDGGLFANGTNVQIWEENGSAAQRFRLNDLNATVPAGTVEPGYYRLVFALDGSSVVDVKDDSRENGASLQVRSRNGMLAQVFKIEQLPSGYYAIRMVNSGKTLDVDSNNAVATTKVQAWDYETAFKEWGVRTNDDGTVTFLAASSGLALDVPDADPGNGMPLRLYYDNGTSAQKWLLEPAQPEAEEGIVTLTVPMLSATRVVDVANASPDAGANIQLCHRNDSSAQKFSLERTEGDTYRFQSLCSGLYLSAEGNNAVQNPLGGLAQEWTLEFAWGGFTLRNVATGKVLDVSDAGDFDGCNIGLYEENGTIGQVFAFARVPAVSPGIYTLRSACGPFALDVAGGSRTAGANVQIGTTNGSGSQIWRIADAGDGWFTVVNAKSGKALDVENGASAPGTNVQQWEVNGANAQKWRFVPSGDGWYWIESACGELRLDVADGAAVDGANVQVYAPNESAAQKFRLYQSDDYSMSGNAELDAQIAQFVDGCTSEWMSDAEKLRACFDRIARFPYRTMSHEPWGSTDWSQWRALDMIYNGSGNCYNYAALFMWCAVYLGYDAQVVSGAVPSLSQGWADHGWVEVYLDGYTYVCDPDLAKDYPSLNWYMRTYGNAPTTYLK